MSEISTEQLSELRQASRESALASMRVVYAAQLGELSFGATVKDVDQSLLTKVDLESERAAKRAWRAVVDYPILGEETGESGGQEDDYILGMDDPIDGTRPFVIGAHTSTVMAGAFDRRVRRIVAAAIGHPTSGMLIEALAGGDTYESRVDSTSGNSISERSVKEVWTGPLAGSTVLVDNFAPFVRKRDDGTSRQITDRQQLMEFQGALLDTGCVPQGYGSNGYHQMLLARGREKLAGAVMLSQGGPWDALGLLAVENAGGSARAFAVLESGGLEERVPHDPFTWDLMVLGNTKTTTDALSNAIERSYRR